MCGRSKRVFPYHVWLPFDAKRTPFYQVHAHTRTHALCSHLSSLTPTLHRTQKVYFVLNFLAGFSLVCCILPIDLMVMSYMRYIRFQFGLLKQDLVNYTLARKAIRRFLCQPQLSPKRFIIGGRLAAELATRRHRRRAADARRGGYVHQLGYVFILFAVRFSLRFDQFMLGPTLKCSLEHANERHKQKRSIHAERGCRRCG